ncbi:hypothetical protein K9L27_04025 [Candidatus Gracilibacteria bacterium]|nr:hypothetical protein [Candidatus Gracilibacteria bacterium]
MKWILNSFRSFENSWYQGVIWQNTPAGPTEGAGTASSDGSKPETKKPKKALTTEKEKEKNVLDILENPLQFSLRHVAELEKAVKDGKLNETQKAKFRTLVGYFFSLGADSLEKVPPRVLFRIQQSKALMALISPQMSENLKLLLSQQRDKLRELLHDKEAKSMTPGQISKIASLYRYLHIEALQTDGSMDEVFEKAKKVLMDLGVPLLERFKFHYNKEKNVKSKDYRKEIEGVIRGDENHAALTSTEKLLLLEIHSLFPKENQWGDEKHSRIWKSIVEAATKNIFQEEDATEYNPNYTLAWELIDEFLNGEEEKEDPEVEDMRLIKTLEAFRSRGKIAEFLIFAKKHPVLLESHLDALKQILSEKEEDQFSIREALGLEFNSVKWAEALKSESDSIQDLEEEIKKIKDNKSSLEESAFEEVLKEDKSGDLSSKYRKIKDEAKERLGGDISDSVIKRMKEEEVSKIKIFESTLEKEVTNLEELEKDKTKETEIKNLRSQITTIRQRLSDSEKKLRELVDLEKRIAQAKVDVLRKFKFREEDQAKITELQKRVDELENQKFARIRENEVYLEMNEFLVRPKEIAENVQKKYYTGLSDRIKNHSLHAADIEVLSSRSQEADTADLIRGEKVFFTKFHKAFEAVLQDINISSTGDLQYQEWIDHLNKVFNYKNLENKLIEQGFNIRKEFGDEQVVTTVLDGALRYFREQIREKIPVSDEKLKQDILTHWERLHSHIDSVQEVQNQYSGREFYNQVMISADKKIEDQKKEYDAVVDGLGLDDEKESDVREKKSLQEVFEYSKISFENGRAIDIDGKEIFIPGKKKLAQAVLMTRDIREAINNHIYKFTGTFPEISQGIELLKSDDPKYLSKRKDLAMQWENEIIPSWQIAKKEIPLRLEQMKEECRSVFGTSPQVDAFLEGFFKACEGMMTRLNDIFDQVETFDDILKNPGYLQALVKDLNLLKRFSDFRDGFWAEMANRITEKFEAPSKGLQVLKENEYYEKPDEFEERFKAVQDKFRAHFSSYSQHMNRIKRIIDMDIDKLEDERFFQKYKLSKAQAENVMRDHSAQNEQFEGIWREFNDPQFIQDWMNGYKGDDPEKKLEKLEQLGKWEIVTATAEKAEGQSKSLSKWLDDYRADAGAKKKVWSTQSFSLYDIYATIKQGIQANETNWKRKSDKAVSAMGMKFFGTDNYFGKEFKRMGEESEGQRVKEFETQYGDYDGWVLEDVLERTSNPDEMRAIFNLMKEKGFLQWDSPSVWRALMRVQNIVTFNIPEDQYLSLFEIKEKVKAACAPLWNADVYRKWDISLGDDLKKVKDGHAREFALYENDDKPRIAILSGMLQRWEKGDATDVDPAKYEAFLFEAFRLGKMNGQPDARWYYFVMGLTVKNPSTGKPILSREIMTRIGDDFLARFPHSEFLVDKGAPKKNGRIVPAGLGQVRPWNFTDYEAWKDMLGSGNGTYDFKNNTSIRSNTETFFYEVINECPDTVQRVQRMGRFFDQPDHDDGVNYQAAWTQDQVNEALTLDSVQKKKESPDFWRSWLSGFDMYMKHKKHLIEVGDQTWGNNPDWLKAKRKHLLDVGYNLKVSLTATQTLQGNFAGLKRNNTAIFTKHDWDTESGYAIKAEPNKQKINSFMKNLFDQKGEDKAYYELLDLSLADKYGANWTDREASQEYKNQYGEKVQNLLAREQGTQKYFTNTTALEEALNRYCSEHGGVSAGYSLAA